MQNIAYQRPTGTSSSAR
uniref:Uncharacterized protein n=1 Tax=Arundo donax TaxID=35708 RepID=A0A0A9BF36_ARUDO